LHTGNAKKRHGKAKIPARAVTETKPGQKVKIVFVRHRHKRDCLAIISTKTGLANEEVVRIYGKKWDIEGFPKIAKHHLVYKKLTAPQAAAT